MRWGIAYAAAVLSGAFIPCSSAFMAPRRSHTAVAVTTYTTFGTTTISSGNGNVGISSNSALAVGSLGWDNDNYMDALSKGPEALEKANEQYKKNSRFTNMRPAGDGDDDDEYSDSDDEVPLAAAADELVDDEGRTKGAALSKDQIERIKRQNSQDETAGGGEMFKKLLERAQEGPTRPPPQMAAIPPPPASAATPPALPAGFENLSVEAQAALFRQLMMNPAADAPVAAREQWPPAPGPRPPATGQAAVAADGRRIGRNRDADAIVNTSDVYFAQLKVDSTVRNLARFNGDHETAEAVFADPTIKNIKLHVNPHMEEARRKEQEMIETAAEEMIFPEVLYGNQKPVNLSYRGVSYKEMMAQKKAAKNMQASVGTATAATSAPPKAAEVEALPRASAPNEPPITPPPPAFVSQQPVVAASVTAATPTRAAPAAAAATKTPEDVRRDIRTLMGLLLKHRGGPGFGAGRIQGAEIARFETLAADLVATLRAEAPTAAAPANQYFQQEYPPAAPVTVAAAGGAIAQAPRVPLPAGDRINSMLACIEGAVQMYKNSPPELQEGVLVTLRAALLSAMGTCNEIVAFTDPRTAPSATATQFYDAAQPSAPSAGPGGAIAQAPRVPAGDRINSMLAYIEGAILMYKNAPPELQGGVLVTLRMALLSAVSTCNEIVAYKEVEKIEAYDPRTASSVVSTTPTQFYDVVPEAPEQQVQFAASDVVSAPADITPTYSGNDENSAFLETVYKKLKEAAGEGKMGLRKDLGAADAEDLANDIFRMRSLLVDELNGGIPESSSIDTSASSSPTTSKYQEMLAKVRADKAAGI